MIEPWIPISSAMKELGKGRKFIENLCNDGYLETRKLNNRVYVTRQSLNAFLEKEWEGE